ncbi:MAG: hypothetical protein ACR2KT_06230, partial [Methylocella sp.]
PEERIVLRIARLFGECELDMPPGFAAEIHNYIQKWRSSGRLSQDIRMAKERGYAMTISEELLAEDLPPQFFYLLAIIGKRRFLDFGRAGGVGDIAELEAQVLEIAAGSRMVQ